MRGGLHSDSTIRPIFPLEKRFIQSVTRSPPPPILPERWRLPSVQPAHHPWEMRCTHCAVGPSPLRDEVYTVCSEPLISHTWSLPIVKPATHRSWEISPWFPRNEVCPEYDYHISPTLAYMTLFSHPYIMTMYHTLKPSEAWIITYLTQNIT